MNVFTKLAIQTLIWTVSMLATCYYHEHIHTMLPAYLILIGYITGVINFIIIENL